ncbi:MAU2 chromatid cohesion factor [Neolecta irregularis DAH-3]|uniref:MAU2 chromatid cohesion factor n=1 Tax=Neolecta irregularis (strain DAH-3) TaxID=1198029 RepID=A0A1U7LJZ5_NEOID|nr:MAU2 chromatid cohesion factor [Neolecta irregularis DAH-3]|eukprot:OLL22872.1 MAU2 chromatid cohesion factor [Neolecta irregularis DAH-3]
MVNSAPGRVRSNDCCIYQMLNGPVEEIQKLHPIVQLKTRLRLGEIFLSETRNLREAEQVLGKGLLVAQKFPHLSDLHWAIEHLLIQVLSFSLPKSAITRLNKCFSDSQE